jgi:hypothetical protein
VLQKKSTGKAVLLDDTKKGDSSITSTVNRDTVQHKPTSSMSHGITNVDHIIPHSDQDLLNRHLTTLATVGAVQPTEAELHAAYKLIANMGTMGLLGQFGPMPSGVASKEPLQQH